VTSFYTTPPRPGPGLDEASRTLTPSARSEPAAGFEAVAAFPPVPFDRLWYVDRVTVTMPGAGLDCQAFLCIDELDAAAVVDGTEQGGFDVSEASTPYVVPGGSRLLVVWTGPEVFTGLVGLARLDVRSVPAPPGGSA
jgi:hypothetical protein